jgi:transcriptional regulator with XRE-family HTH domain
MPKIDSPIGATAQRLRTVRGLTQEDLAYSAGITVSALSRIERGLSNPTWMKICGVAKALDTTMPELCTAIEQNERTIISDV